MITLRRARDRHYEQRDGHETWHTFALQDQADLLPDGFGAIIAFDEIHLSPRGCLPRNLKRDAEIVSYLRVGTLAYEDAEGLSDLVYAGEFQRRSARRCLDYTERNESTSDGAQVFQIWLSTAASGPQPRHERKRFGMAQRRGLMCVIASTDARCGSVRLRQDAVMVSAILGPGQHVVHEHAPGRSSWLHIVHGEVSLADLVLTTGDGIGIADERAFAFTARRRTEVLLVDLGERGVGPP